MYLWQSLQTLLQNGRFGLFLWKMEDILREGGVRWRSIPFWALKYLGKSLRIKRGRLRYIVYGCCGWLIFVKGAVVAENFLLYAWSY